MQPRGLIFFLFERGHKTAEVDRARFFIFDLIFCILQKVFSDTLIFRIFEMRFFNGVSTIFHYYLRLGSTGMTNFFLFERGHQTE